MSTQAVSFSELEAAAKPANSAVSQATIATTETKTETTSVAQPQFTEQDISTLRTLSDAGITLTNYQQLLQANELLQKLPSIIKTNPSVVTAEIAKADPEAYKIFLEAVSDEWWEKIGKHDPRNQSTAQGTASSVAPSPDPRIEHLQAQLQTLIQEKNQEKTERQQQAVFTGYKNAVDGLLAKVPADVPETAKDYIRLKTQELIYNDAQARDRVAKGIYVDLPKYFAEASAKATADIKASAGKEHAARQAVEARGGKEITPAAEAVNGTSAGPQEDPVWGDSGMMRDLQTALKSK